jgi:predicted transcriptional regulator of viral defense system
MSQRAERPDWSELYALASAQSGYFTLRQANEAGFSSQLLHDHLKNGRIERPQRGVYRLAFYPPTDDDELVTIWLWSRQEGVFSHQTALALHHLSDILPAKIHVTLPGEWRRRVAPAVVVKHYGAVEDRARAWHGAVPVTSVGRTLNDCATEGVAPDVLQHAAAQALRRGLVTRHELVAVDAALRPFGGLAA